MIKIKILGINDCKDAAAVVIKDGKIESAVEEERFIYKRHKDVFPYKSVNYSLKNKDVDCITYGMDYKRFKVPSLKNYFIPLLLSQKRIRILGVMDKIPQRYVGKIADLCYSALFKGLMAQRAKQRRELDFKLKKPSYIIPHHLAHAASAYRVSGFKKANILVLDGSGEAESTSLFVGNNEITKLKSYSQDNSLGILYTMVTILLGLSRYGQGKTMALASYGKEDKQFQNMLRFKGRDYEVSMNKLPELSKLKRYPHEKLQKIHEDIAATLQTKLETAALNLLETLYEQTGYKNLCIAGGVALNCAMNSALLNSDYVKRIFVQPAANDAGVALGSALELAYEKGFKSKRMMHAYYGPEYTNDEIKETLLKTKLDCSFYEDIEGVAADLLSKDKIIGWFQGKMELGPRALGNRSILASPTKSYTRDKVNDIKKRERWRPLAPSVLEEKMKFYFINTHPSPFMNLTFEVNPEKQHEIPAIVHVDGSARVQTVTKEANKRYYNLIKKFETNTGIPLLLNTSFNSRNQPIVRTPADAINTFKYVGLDYLIMGNWVIKK